jgi:uncharacterized protein (UPF0332 family)
MNGREFLDSAKTLGTSARPSDLRSAVSRAYYGSYHAALELLESAGVRFTKGTPEAHTKMSQCLDNSNVTDAEKVARELNSLRDDRNTADYDMADTVFEKSTNVQFRILAAEQIIKQIDALVAVQSDRDALRAILKARAKQLGVHTV